MAKRPPLTVELASLFRSIGAKQFLSDYFEKNFCVVHHECSTLANIKGVLGDFDVEKIINDWQPRYIVAWFDVGRKQHRSMRLDPNEALRQFSKGATLYFHLNGNPTADAWLAQLCSEIGLPIRGQVSILASPKATGIRPHFDANNNFTVQLSGSKLWSIGCNEDIRFPIQNYVPTQSVHSDLRLAAAKRIEEISPRSLEHVKLSPGSVMYLPRGYWHGTTTIEGPSLSLNVLCPPFTWVEAVCVRLRQTLLESDVWRKSAHGLLNDWDTEGQRMELEALIKDLRMRVNAIKANHFFRGETQDAMPLRDNQLISRCPLAGWSISSSYGESAYMVEIIDSAGLSTKLKVRREFLEVLQKIGRSDASMPVGSFFCGHTDNNIEQIRLLITRLRSSGFLTVI